MNKTENLLSKISVGLILVIGLCLFFNYDNAHAQTTKTIYRYTPLPLDHQFENKHVFLIGLDGWGAYSFAKSNMPTVEEIIAGGSHTLKALAVMPSITIPNWASMFMGAGPDVHGYNTNPLGNDNPPVVDSPIIDRYGIFPSIFTLLKEERPNCKVAFFFEKPKIGYLCPDNVIDEKRHLDLSIGGPAIDAVVSYIENEKPNFAAIIFLEPDETGHRIGHDTTEYYDQLNKLDGYIAQIIQAIKNAGIWEDSIIIFSADHGGIGRGHGNDTPVEREIPVILAGPNIYSAYEITEPVMTYDIAATIAGIFQLETPPFWVGKQINVFETPLPPVRRRIFHY
jgi:predicted AlkP superfamily pyrophosphatase or phosphodiesterase